ncbi:3'-5' exoribonuclease [Paraburkholderia sp. RG36]|uniref:3'-5' exoribonuclease n=2 Tax=Paraburkholderia tagetis TaxID=2913261 RepID=A0A9X1ZZL5_9BURK|nr:3'-5' exoribonuclease [Paraburkholderia tagetis]
MRIFVDCEFTDFLECELVSLALVADDGREFYGECSEYDPANCSEFVRAAVLPQLGQHVGRVFTRGALRVALVTWLGQFDCEPERSLCFDYGGDWDLLCDLLDGPPPGWRAVNVAGLLDRRRSEDYYRAYGGRHHALADARANRYAMMRIDVAPSD